ncbi:hypothetical protein F5B20DRAFT_560050 [Whalleya microplaca]|nr:hypothetical protein F5B20DRAFT_560050 [Whalleya microplaca]
MTSTTKKVEVDGVVLTIPKALGPHCWQFQIVYSCGCPVMAEHHGLVREKVIHVKQDDHSGPCWMRRCVTATQTHVLPEKCHRCEVYDIESTA